MSDLHDRDVREEFARAFAEAMARPERYGKAGGHNRHEQAHHDPPKVPKKRVWARCFAALCVWRKSK